MTALPTLTAGKVRGLAATSAADGTFRILAVDHRDSMRVVIDPEHPERLAPSELTDVKLDLIRHLAGDATAVMLDPEYSAAQAIVNRALPGSVGFLAAVEAQGYLGDPTARQTSLLEDWGVGKAKRLGANAIKLLVLYRPDAEAVTDAQDELIQKVVADCAHHDIPLFLEPLAYRLDRGATDEQFATIRRSIVIDTVRRLGALRPDVLKVQFPVDTGYEPDRRVWEDACAELDATSPVPWALLSGGDPYEQFRDQVQIACAAGASGFLVGRALWGEYLRADPVDRPDIMSGVVQPRFAELAAINAAHGRDWGERYQMERVDEVWYRSY